MRAAEGDGIDRRANGAGESLGRHSRIGSAQPIVAGRRSQFGSSCSSRGRLRAPRARRRPLWAIGIVVRTPGESPVRTEHQHGGVAALLGVARIRTAPAWIPPTLKPTGM